MKKFLLILLMVGLIVCLLVGCNITTPSEGEGEGDSEGEGEEEEIISRVVLVELFTVGCPNCKIVEPILEQLAEEDYERSEMILVEEIPYTAVQPVTIGANDRYKWYLPDINQRETPNALFNGSNQRIWKVASRDSFKSIIDKELAKEAKISINVSRTGDSESTTLSGSIKNISLSTLNNLLINGMAFNDRGVSGQKYLVSNIFAGVEETGVNLEPGAEQSFIFIIEELSWEANNVHGIIFVQDKATKEVYQAQFVE